MAIDTDIPTEKQDASPAASPVLGVHDRVDEISLLDLLIALTKRKRLTFAITLVCGNLGLVVALILPKCYTAVATILSQQQSSSMASAFASQIGKPGDDGFVAGRDLGLKNPNDMYVVMFNSQTVEDGMIRRFRLMHECRQQYLSVTRKVFGSNFTVNEAARMG